MSTLMLAGAGGCLILAVMLVYALWAAHTNRAEFDRLVALLDIQPALPANPAAPHTQFLPAELRRKFHQAGWQPDRYQILPGLLGVFLVIGEVSLAAGILAGILAGLGALLSGGAALEYRARTRMRVLSDSMLGFLERVRQLITVGNSLSVALTRAVENSPPAVCGALSPTIRRIANGSGVAESLERCAGDLGLYELHLLATAARINLRFGGSFTQILRNMIETIRKRTAIERELRADTTQIRASAWVLALLPMLVATVVMLTNRGYARWFLQTHTGHVMIVYAVISQLVGAWFMRLITRSRY